MTRLVLLNGAPGSGKSTLAALLATERPMTVALEVDAIKHSLSGWDADPTVSGLHAKRLSLALAGEHLIAGYDIVMGQYLARTTFIEELDALATRHAARFVELVLDLDAETLAHRIAGRHRSPDRPEHSINNPLVGAQDAGRLVDSMNTLRERRPLPTTRPLSAHTLHVGPQPCLACSHACRRHRRHRPHRHLPRPWAGRARS